MSTSPRFTLLLAAGLAVLCSEGIAHARTTDSALAEELQALTASVAPATTPATPNATQHASSGAEARIRALRVCRIPRHPRDGVPASIHACPLVFASAESAEEASQPLPATRVN
jgi:hypothetical protein